MYQFIHIETYSRVSSKKKLNEKYNKETKGRNVSEIIAEATRKPGFCDHVAEPAEPVLLYGVSPHELEKLTDDYFNNTKLTNSKGVVRGLRKDSHVLLAGVISLNREVEEIWDDYKKEAIEWLKKKYGDRLKCVIEHTDEEHPHIHFYCVQDPGLSFDLLHEGKRAFSEVGGKIKHKKEKAFRDAMKDFQDDFFLKVSAKYGLMKTGPRRKRLSNKDYWQQKKEIELLNKYKKEANEEIRQLNEKVTLEKAKAFKLGFNRGLDQAVNEFNSNNALNKIIFSVSYRKKEFLRYKSSSEHYKNEAKKLNERKDLYKDRLNKEITRNKENKILFDKINKENETYKKIDFFMNEAIEFNDKKENKDDYRRKITEQISAIETEQQQFSDDIKKIESRNNFNVREINRVEATIRRSFRILFSNVKNFIVDFFRIESFERMFKEEKSKEIKRFEFKENSKEENNEFKKDRRLIIK